MTEVPHDAEEESRTEVTIRRAPKFSAFLAIGALVGLLGTLILTSLFPADPEVGFAATFGFFVVYGIALGVLLSAILAIVLDRRASRRSATVTAGKVEVHAEKGESTPSDSSQG